MKTLSGSFIPAISCVLAVLLSTVPLRAGSLSEHDREFLAGYEKIRAALVLDDLAAAKTGATALGETGAGLAKSRSLSEARAAFSVLSEQALKVTAGVPGYYAVHCSMLKKTWVQTTKAVGNPYAGKKMPECGEIKP
jgi:hypothetical protein